MPSLFLHPDRRIRYQAANLHAIFAPLIPKYGELGSWLLVAHDVERDVATIALPTWEQFFDAELMDTDSLISYTQRSILDPRPLVLEFLSESELEQEKAEDLEMRMRVAGLGALGYLLTKEVGADNLLNSTALWTCLYPHPTAPFHSGVSFGDNQPAIRRAAWGLVHRLPSTVYTKAKPPDPEDDSDDPLPLASTAVLRSAFAEEDVTVHSSSGMWKGLLGFLKGLLHLDGSFVF